jgi:hypothetical protein
MHERRCERVGVSSSADADTDAARRKEAKSGGGVSGSTAQSAKLSQRGRQQRRAVPRRGGQ